VGNLTIAGVVPIRGFTLIQSLFKVFSWMSYELRLDIT